MPVARPQTRVFDHLNAPSTTSPIRRHPEGSAERWEQYLAIRRSWAPDNDHFLNYANIRDKWWEFQDRYERTIKNIIWAFTVRVEELLTTHQSLANVRRIRRHPVSNSTPVSRVRHEGNLIVRYLNSWPVLFPHPHKKVIEYDFLVECQHFLLYGETQTKFLGLQDFILYRLYLNCLTNRIIASFGSSYPLLYIEERAWVTTFFESIERCGLQMAMAIASEKEHPCAVPYPDDYLCRWVYGPMYAKPHGILESHLRRDGQPQAKCQKVLNEFKAELESVSPEHLEELDRTIHLGWWDPIGLLRRELGVCRVKRRFPLTHSASLHKRPFHDFPARLLPTGETRPRIDLRAGMTVGIASQRMDPSEEFLYDPRARPTPDMAG